MTSKIVIKKAPHLRTGKMLVRNDILFFSWLFLRGRCRKCKEPISPQYPIIEALNGILYIVVFAVNGLELTSIIYCFLTSALIVLSVIDWRTYEIPLGINIFCLLYTSDAADE